MFMLIRMQGLGDVHVLLVHISPLDDCHNGQATMSEQKKLATASCKHILANTRICRSGMTNICVGSQFHSIPFVHTQCIVCPSLKTCGLTKRKNLSQSHNRDGFPLKIRSISGRVITLTRSMYCSSSGLRLGCRTRSTKLSKWKDEPSISTATPVPRGDRSQSCENAICFPENGV